MTCFCRDVDPSLTLELPNQEGDAAGESEVFVGSEVASPTKSEHSIEDELSEVKLKDTSSMLADLDSEVSTMVRIAWLLCDHHVTVM